MDSRDPDALVGRLYAEHCRAEAASAGPQITLPTLIALITDLHGQHADDRCWMNTDALFRAVGLPVPDRRVGDKFAMLANCARFIERQCEGGEWPTYAELEARIEELAARAEKLEEALRLTRAHDDHTRGCRQGPGCRLCGELGNAVAHARIAVLDNLTPSLLILSRGSVG